MPLKYLLKKPCASPILHAGSIISLSVEYLIRLSKFSKQRHITVGQKIKKVQEKNREIK